MCAAQTDPPIVVAVDCALNPNASERSIRLGSTSELHIYSGTSGSTRAPAVLSSHKNVITNRVQLMSDYIGDSEKVQVTPVSWLPF